MRLLIDRILQAGKYLGNGIIKVDSFINHQLDPALLNACGKAFAEKFKDSGATRILTAEISGIPPALMAGLYLKIPVIYARKNKPITMAETVYATQTPSRTKGSMVDLTVSAEYLSHLDHVLIIDDFLAGGSTVLGLNQIILAAKAKLVGVGVLIEKGFENGRSRLASLNVPIESLACIESVEKDKIICR